MFAFAAFRVGVVSGATDILHVTGPFLLVLCLHMRSYHALSCASNSWHLASVFPRQKVSLNVLRTKLYGPIASPFMLSIGCSVFTTTMIACADRIAYVNTPTPAAADLGTSHVGIVEMIMHLNRNQAYGTLFPQIRYARHRFGKRLRGTRRCGSLPSFFISGLMELIIKG